MKKIPAEIVNAATTMLSPYFPKLTSAGLVEALSRNEPEITAPAIRKPLTRFEAAEILQVSVATINRYLRDGVLRRNKVGKRLVRIDPACVEALLKAPGEMTDAD